MKNFRNNKRPKEGSQFICLSVILIDFVFGTGKLSSSAFRRTYIFKEKKIPKYIIDNIEISSDCDHGNKVTQGIPSLFLSVKFFPFF